MKKLVCYLVLAVFLLSPAGTASAKLFSGTFADIQGHWAESEIEAAYSQGLMLGTGVNEFGYKTFSPEEKVNRFQLAAVLARAFELDYGNMRFMQEPETSDYYYDLREEAWYSQAVVLGAVNHLFPPQGSFAGEENVSRIEVARSIYNAFQARGITIPMIMLMPLYDDTAQLSRDDANAMVFVSNTGIMKGNDNLFRPYDPIKRAELARVLNQCVKLIEMNPVQAGPVSVVKLECKEVKSESPLINIDLNIPVITGLQDKEIQARLNEVMENDARQRQEAMEQQAQLDSDFILAEPLHTYGIASRFNQYYVTRDILSFYVDYYTYTGGAHGMTDRVAYNFDLNTGQELALSDLFAPDSNHIEMINERVRSIIALNPEEYFEGEHGFQGINEEQRFYLENGNLIVYFLQYEIAPYAAGIRTFPVALPSAPDQQADSDEAAVMKLVSDFGSKLKNVSLLAPAEAVKNSLQENYGGLASPALLAKWQNDPDNAPGRAASSPWPERIDITVVEKLSDSSYEIKGEIITMTSVEMVNGGVAGKKPVILEAEKIDNRWLITSYEYEDAAVYSNGEYGFTFSLPESWQGYSIIAENWEGIDPESSTKENGPLISIRHPQWTEQNPRQDIPIMVFTHHQWNLIQQEELSVGAAPIPPKELDRNTKYVFALPARYNFAFPTGYEEVEKILESNPLRAFEPGSSIKPVEANIRINNFSCSHQQLTVTGTARVWEANVLYEVTDKNDKVLSNGFTTASIGAPEWGEFSFSIEGDLSEAHVLRVFAESAKDGSRMDTVEYFLKPFGRAEILAKEPGSILVEGVLDGYSDQPTRFYFAISPETIITDANNIQLSESQLQPGDELQIWVSYPGLVLESWPAQAGAGKIVRITDDIDWQGLAADFNPLAIDGLLAAIKNNPVAGAGNIEITADIKREFNQMGEDYRFFFMPEVSWYDFDSDGAAISYMIFTWSGEFGTFPESVPPYQAEARLRKVFAAPDDAYPPLIHQAYPKLVRFDGAAYSPWPESYNSDTMVYDLIELKERHDGNYTYYTATANEYGFDVNGHYEPGANEEFLLAKSKALGLDYDSTLEKLLANGQITGAEKSRTYKIEFRVDTNSPTPKIVAVDRR